MAVTPAILMAGMAAEATREGFSAMVVDWVAMLATVA